jgi:hypothetical protein
MDLEGPSEESDRDLRDLLSTLDPKARDDLRRVLIRDQADRDAIASRLMRYRDQNGQDWADIIDFLMMYPEARRRVTRSWGRSRPGSISRRSRIEGVGGERQLREARRVAHGLRRPLHARLQCQRDGVDL